MWHVSVAPASKIALSPNTLRAWALRELDGVGDVTRGQWEEWTGRAYHVRRRLSEAEEAVIGPAVDIRGKPEALERLAAVRKWLPAGWIE